MTLLRRVGGGKSSIIEPRTIVLHTGPQADSTNPSKLVPEMLNFPPSLTSIKFIPKFKDGGSELQQGKASVHAHGAWEGRETYAPSPAVSVPFV